MDLKGVTRGQFVIGSSISPPAGYTPALILEVNVVGYFGSQPAVVDRGALSATFPSRRFRFDDSEGIYTSLGVEVRQVADGVPDTIVVPQSFKVQATGIFWS